MRRYDRALAEFRRDKFRRLVLAAVAGVMLAHLLPMNSTVFIGLYPASILLGMDRFSVGALLLRCVTLLVGMVVGTLIIEAFMNAPILSVMITYGVFLVILKLFAIQFEMGNAYSFMFAYSLSTIYASYPDSTMEASITEPYLIQTVLIFFVVWGCFALFPAQPPTIRRASPPPPEIQVGNGELMIYALIWLGIWLFFLFFEWRFALFAFLSFAGAFRCFDRNVLKKITRENIIAHVFCCSVAALFSLLLPGTGGNILVLLAGLIVLVLPFLHAAVFPPKPELAYRCSTMLSGLLVPLILYLGTDHAAVYQSALRAALIVFLMAILYLVIESLYHGGTVVKKVSRCWRQHAEPDRQPEDQSCTSRI